MTFFPACTPLEVMAPFSVPITALIPNDPQPDLVVPCYPQGQCPEPTRIRVSDYAAGQPSSYYVPVYSNPAFILERFSRPLSALVPVVAP